MAQLSGIPERLDEAINSSCRQSSQQAIAHRQRPGRMATAAQAGCNAFDALFERHRASEAKLEGRQEQKAQDEWAARRKDNEQGS
jgi:flagellar biosynthesis chaperone FliJ